MVYTEVEDGEFAQVAYAVGEDGDCIVGRVECAEVGCLKVRGGDGVVGGQGVIWV